MPGVPVNPDVLKWAREQRGLKIVDAANLLGITPEDLASLESGANQPNRSILNKMASRYQWRLEVLLMPDILPRKPLPKDYRQKTNREFDPSLFSLIGDIQSLSEEILELINDGSLEFPKLRLDKINPDVDINSHSLSLRKRIGLTHDKQLKFKDYRDFFQFLRYKIESLGVLVFLEKIDTSLCRGFAIIESNELATIVVNDKEDSYAPKIFTLIHELVHIMLRRPGISDQNEIDRIERFCNAYAAAFLMPISLINSSIGKNGPYSNRTIYEMAKYLTVSQSSLVIRLESLGYVEKGHYFDWLDSVKDTKYKDSKITKTRLSKGIILPHTKTVKSFGALASKSVIESALDQRITQRRAYEILNLGNRHFEKALNQSINQISKATS